jgi:MoaA/NifB/PqqE/SkfB family radical SAM enzyme
MIRIDELIKIVRPEDPLDYNTPFDKFRLNLRYHFAEKLNLPIAKPHWVYISLTNNCNYNCHMCGVIKQDRTTKLSTEKLKSLIDEIAGWKSDQVVTFTGGEIFLTKEIIPLIEYSISKNLKTEIISNASLITVERAKKLMSLGLQSINMSLDGSIPEIHNKIRNNTRAFELTTNGIKNLVKQKKLNNGKGPQLSVWTTIQKWNIPDLMDITYYAKKLGVDKHVFHPIIINQCDMQTEPDVTNNPLWPNQEDIKILKDQVKKMTEYEKKNGFIAFIHDPQLFVDYFNGRYSKKAWKCNPFQFLNIGPDGKTQICGDSFGNVNETNIVKAYSSEKAAEHRLLMKKCTLNCLQTCWARPESDNLSIIISSFLNDMDKNHVSSVEKKTVLKKGIEEIKRYETLVHSLIH